MTRGNLSTAGSVSTKGNLLSPVRHCPANFETFSSTHLGVLRQLRLAGRVAEGSEAAVSVTTGPLEKCQGGDVLEEARGRVAPSEEAVVSLLRSGVPPSLASYYEH